MKEHKRFSLGDNVLPTTVRKTKCNGCNSYARNVFLVLQDGPLCIECLRKKHPGLFRGFRPNMKLEISEDILRKTRCKKDFSCLSGEMSDLCKVELRAGGQDRNVILLENLEDKSCTYTTSFGYAYICNCPTRKEIYDRYVI